jgi:SAM-dependent methyltransferase
MFVIDRASSQTSEKNILLRRGFKGTSSLLKTPIQPLVSPSPRLLISALPMDFKDSELAKKYKPGEVISAPYAAFLLADSGFSSDIAASDSKEFTVLDNACGTGIVTAHVYQVLPIGKSINLVCGDISQSMIDSVTARIGENDWKGSSAKIIDAQVNQSQATPFSHRCVSPYQAEWAY